MHCGCITPWGLAYMPKHPANIRLFSGSVRVRPAMFCGITPSFTRWRCLQADGRVLLRYCMSASGNVSPFFSFAPWHASLVSYYAHACGHGMDASTAMLAVALILSEVFQWHRPAPLLKHQLSGFGKHVRCQLAFVSVPALW